ncbi:twinkle homolog protein, chloroplastic/mitochondrial isoform X2 [Cajanus cajan]|nr:twinkle homolog protein, chloroplastic/mitochondrial isoform X2 [Cajanus cajan]
MHLRYPLTLRPLFTTMTTQTLLRSSPFPPLKTPPSSQRHRFPHHRPFFTVFCSKPISRNPPSPLRTNGYHGGASHASIPRPVQLETTPVEKHVELQFNILKKKLDAVGMETGICVPGQYNHLLCPKCLGGDQEERSLSLYIAPDGGSAAWVCFRAKCGWKGSTQAFAGRSSSTSQVTPVQKKREITVEELQLEPLCNELLAYFSERLISKETLERNAVRQRTYHDQIVIAFTYRRNGALVSCKYRDINKKFWQEENTEKIFYGLDDIVGQSDIIIVEGEMDKLAMEEAGFFNCVSVPDGAPPSVSSKELPSPDQDKKYQYLWNCKDELKQATRVILATDGDSPGQALAEELARRIGKEKCWRVRWPKKGSSDNCKDANEVLMYLGPDALKEAIENAELYPIRGLFNFRDYFDEIDAYYYQTLGYEIGIPTGWNNLNDLYNVVPGELTIVTGVPNSGKSEWIDALLCNLNEIAGWKFALCSMENKVREHARKLLEKHLKKPFFNVRYGENVERMSVEEFEQGKLWLSDTFSLIRCEDDSLPNINWVLNLAKAAVLRHGVRGLVIDPYNELDHQRPPNQ